MSAAQSSRPTVRAPRAMVAAAHPLASEAGLAVLREGGSAVDAGLAVNAVLNVVQPPCCGFGGDAFFLYFDAGSGELVSYNASGRSPAAASLATYRELGCETMPARGPLAVTVPGVADGWAALHHRFGRLPWGPLFAAGIHYAADGFPVSDNLAGWIADSRGLLGQWPSSARAMLPDGNPPRPGQRLRQPDLARTFQTLADGGAEAFYRGELGAAVTGAVRAAGGLLQAADLADHHGDWTVPLRLDYRGWEVAVHPPNSQGWCLPLMLGLLAEHDLGRLPLGSAELVHLGIEAKRLAFADRDAYLTDPTAMSIDPAELLAPGYLARRRQAIAPDRAMPDPAPGDLAGDTTYFAVVDPMGNALSCIQSLFRGFGSGFVAGDTGLFLQNRGAYFSFDPAAANVLAPGKRTAHTLCAAMVLRDGRPCLVPGTMGGDGQPQILFQLLVAMLDHGLPPQTAIDLPRWVHGPAAAGPTASLEARFDPATVAALWRLGHRVELLDDWAALCGHAQVIAIDADGLAGGADPRGDGQAAGF